MKMLRAGVIGLGVGEQHVRSYQSIENVEVAAICDLNESHMHVIKNKYNINKGYSDFRKITESNDIDIVSICSYDNFHAEQCISALNNGKHVMVEKPFTLNKKESESVLRAQIDSGLQISSNLILRKSPRFIEIKKMIEGNQFGEIFCIEGGYIHDILWKLTEGWRGKMDFYCTIYGGGVHIIDLMRWLTNEEITEVSCMGSKILTKNTPYKFDDTFITLLRFSSGALGKCLTTLGPRRTKFHSLNSYGTKKTFINDIPYGKIFDGDKIENESQIKSPYPGMEKGDLIPDFVTAILENRRPEVNSTDVFRAMDICFASREAAELGKTIKVDYLI